MGLGLDKLKELIASAVSDKGLGDTTELSYTAMANRIPELAGIAETLEVAIEDGIGWDDLKVMALLVEPAMKLAAGIEEMAGAQKEAFVVDAIWLTYRTVDTYPDGNSNNINIPIVFGSAERKLEERAVRFGAHWCVTALFRRLRKDGEV